MQPIQFRDSGRRLSETFLHLSTRWWWPLEHWAAREPSKHTLQFPWLREVEHAWKVEHAWNSIILQNGVAMVMTKIVSCEVFWTQADVLAWLPWLFGPRVNLPHGQDPCSPSHGITWKPYKLQHTKNTFLLSQSGTA